MARPTDTLRLVRFHNPRLARVGVEVMDVAGVRARAGASLRAPERVDFLMLLLVQDGRGHHRVDFVEHALRAGDVVMVRPGQVQQWQLSGTLQGQLVLVSPEALAPSIARAGVDMQLLAIDAWPAVSRPPRDAFAAAIADTARLAADIGRYSDSAVDAAIIWHGLLALLLRLARDRGAVAAAGDGVHRLFLRELERQVDQRRSVRMLAARLGYSESTVSRACVAATGRTAKQLLDARIALEAKRLLVHSTATAAQVGHQLGFTEPTNFVKFFKRTAGTTPLAFRAAHRPG
jgi:AraC-like DNA-binding protein